MSEQSNPSPENDVPVVVPPKQNKLGAYWRKMGGGSLTFSIALHAGIILIGGYIFFVRPAEPEKKVDFLPPGGGGGDEGNKEYKVQQKRQVMQNSSIKRVVAENVDSGVTLADPGDSVGEITDLSSSLASSGGLAGDSMGGPGDGSGFGSGTGPGIGGGTADASKLFGGFDKNENLLVGTFYDSKQDKEKKETKEDMWAFYKNIKSFAGNTWNPVRLEKYYQAKQQLYQSKIFLPTIQAHLAPQAFSCEKEVKPGQWVVIYRGNVTPPKSGTYRFVGAGDDVLCVRFNGKPVFDFGYIQLSQQGLTMGADWINNQDINFVNAKGKKELTADWKKRFRESCMNPPFKFYRYSTIPNVNTGIGGLAEGPTFDATAGTSYPIEILVSEGPGGLCSAMLLIKEEGATYKKAKFKWKDSRGIDREEETDILPLFRVDPNSTLPEQPKASYNEGEEKQRPPFDPEGPAWKVVKGSGLSLF